MDRDGPLMAQHLELQIDITGPRHELSISRPSKQGVIRLIFTTSKINVSDLES